MPLIEPHEWGVTYPNPTAQRCSDAVVALLRRTFPTITVKARKNEAEVPLYSKANSLPMFAVVLDEPEDYEFVTGDLMFGKYPLWVVYLVSNATATNILEPRRDVWDKRQTVRQALVLPLQGLDELNDITPGAKAPFNPVAGDGATIASTMTFTLECRENPR